MHEDGIQFEKEEPEPNPLSTMLDFSTWAICLPRWILRCRTAFSWHLWRSFTATWRDPCDASTTAFPLPVPHPGCFSEKGLKHKKISRLAWARKKLLHIVVFSLNYMYLGRFPTRSELERRPNAEQMKVFERLRSLIAVCGEGEQQFIAVPGRSGPELGAALLQMERFADLHPELSQSYVQRKPVKFKEDKHLLPFADHPELLPYRSLDASRLKIVGTGEWPMADFLSGPLWLPFQEPRFLLHGEPDDVSVWPVFRREERSENLKLAKLWDSKGILRLHRKPLMRDHFCKTFNAYKNRHLDRQIGDRRIPNSRERAIDGPSHHLPPGFLLTNLRVEPFVEQVVGSVTDRRDFYHQAKISEERAQSNMLAFAFSEEELDGTRALEEARSTQPTKKQRESVGDGFGLLAEGADDLAVEGKWFPCFGSLFQGDHLGVEFALKAHEEVLQRGGLLESSRRLFGHALFPLQRQIEGLIIDDYFAIGCEPITTSPLNTFASKALAKARCIYEAAGLEGSVEKDIDAQNVFKAAGAEIISSASAVQRGLTLVGAPVEKRLALAALSLRAARLKFASSKLLARLAGSWTSVLLYRRCLTSSVDFFFKLGAEAEASGPNTAVPLTRKVAQELVLLSALSPVAVSNIAVKYNEKVYASDASLGLGAVVSAKVDPETVEVLWLGSDKKGCYSKLDAPAAALLAAAGEEVAEPCGPDHLKAPKRGPLLYFDFVEFFGGSGRVSSCVAALGHSVAPCLDLTASKHYDMTDERLLEWCLYMIEEGRFKAFLTEPPCTTFSPAAHPAVRSYVEPEGFDRRCPKTRLGNVLAFRSFVLLRHGRKFGRPCGKEQPRRSKMAWMRAWRALKRLGFCEAVIASCQFASPHKKEFIFLLHGLDPLRLEVKCPGGHSHVKIQGQLTKGSAVYTWPLAEHLAKEFSRVLRLGCAFEERGPDVFGLESVVSNDVLLTEKWRTRKCWHWKRKSHINVLEAHGGLGVLAAAASDQPDSRFVALMDSRVAKGALAKGRSSADGLQRTCKRSSAIQVAFGLYPGWNFAPTRLNIADDPTRRVPVRSPVPLSVRKGLSQQQIQLLHSCQLSRWASNWLRLCILLLLLQSPAQAQHSDGFSFWTFPESRLSVTLDFDRLYGHLLSMSWTFVWTFLDGIFPLVLALGVSYMVVGWVVTSCPVQRAPYRLLWILIFGLSLADAMEPLTSLERSRAERRKGIELVATRVARQDTLNRRTKLLSDFRCWLFEVHKVSLSQLLSAKPPDPEEICKWLTAYGQDMFLSGKAYGKFAETINAVAQARPVIRKQLVGAWDLAFAWQSDEPGEHHPALPLSILLAIVALALLWGWPLEASVISLTWCGLLRIGEVLIAERGDLILPEDSMPGVLFGLLRIRTPKTRGRAARHQAARIDPPDVLSLLSAVYGKCPSSTRLWPYSAATLRKRFCCLLAGVGLATEKIKGRYPFSLGSLRPGGATHMLLESEDSEKVRRRGRWVTNKVMEIYLQEILYTTFAETLDRQTKIRVNQLAGNFTKILGQSVAFLNSAIPPTTWWNLFQTKDDEELGEGGGKIG